MFDNPMFMLLALAFIWIFLVIIPGRKDRQAKEAMHSGLKKGDKVLVQAGIIGKIAQAKDDTVVLEFNGAKIPFLKNTVVKVFEDKPAED